MIAFLAVALLAVPTSPVRPPTAEELQAALQGKLNESAVAAGAALRSERPGELIIAEPNRIKVRDVRCARIDVRDARFLCHYGSFSSGRWRAVSTEMALNQAGWEVVSSGLEARPTPAPGFYHGELRLGFEYSRFFPLSSEQGFSPRFETEAAQASLKQMRAGLDPNEDHCFRVKVNGRVASDTDELGFHYIQIERVEGEEAIPCAPSR